jgi:hypothetical protein
MYGGVKFDINLSLKIFLDYDPLPQRVMFDIASGGAC